MEEQGFLFHNSDFRQVLDQKGLNVDWKCARTAVEKDFQLSFSSSPLQPCMENMDKKCFRAHVFTKELIYLLLLQFRQVNHKSYLYIIINYLKCSYYYILITIILYMLHLIALEKKPLKVKV